MQTQLIIKREESIERDLKFKLIPYDPIKEQEAELLQMEQLEKEVLMLSDIMKEFGCTIDLQDTNLEQVETNVKETIEHVENANIEMKEAIGIKTEIISTKLGIATVLAIGVNTPIGLVLGTKILAGTLLASGFLTAYWVAKN